MLLTSSDSSSRQAPVIKSESLPEFTLSSVASVRWSSCSGRLTNSSTGAGCTLVKKSSLTNGETDQRTSQRDCSEVERVQRSGPVRGIRRSLNTGR